MNKMLQELKARLYNVSYKSYEGYDSFSGTKSYKVFDSNKDIIEVLEYCKNNNCKGFQKSKKGKYWVKNPKYSKEDLLNNKIYYGDKSWKKNFCLYILD